MALTLIETQSLAVDESEAAASISFDISTSYDAFTWRFYNIHPASTTYANGRLSFQVNNVDEADFDDSLITSTMFIGIHGEADTFSYITYQDADDQDQDAGYQKIGTCVGTEADSNISGYLTIYGTKSPTFVKHFRAETVGNTDNTAGGNDQVQHRFTAGYINDAKVIDEISFKFVSGYINSGTIKMFGIS